MTISSHSTASPSTSRGSSSSLPSLRGDGIELPPNKQAEFLHRINATVDYVLRSMVGDRPSSVYWKPKAENKKRSVEYYVDDNVNPDQYRFCCVSDTNARAEQIINLFRVHDTEHLLRNCRIVYNNVLDARVLRVLRHPTKHQPYKSVYLRYASFATPALMDNRDMCLVVATDVFTHVDGSTIGYCLWDSVEIRVWPELRKSHGVVRSRMFRSGFFCRTASEDLECLVDGAGNEDRSMLTKIVYLVGLEAGGVAPRLASKLVMDKFGANLERLCKYFRRKNLDPATFRPRSQWCSARHVKHCTACSKAFHAFTKRHHCVACGDVFCKACYTKENVDLPGVGITNVRFCLRCLGIRGLDVRHPRTSGRSTSLIAASSAGAFASCATNVRQPQRLAVNDSILPRSLASNRVARSSFSAIARR